MPFSRPVAVVAFLVAVTLTVGGLTPREALAKDDKKKVEEVAEQLQLLPFLMPVQGSNDITDIALFLFLSEVDHFWPVCRNMPRVRNAVNEALYRKGLKRGSDGGIDYVDAATRVRPAINRLFPEKPVVKVLVVSGHLDHEEVKAIVDRKIPKPVNCEIIKFRQKGKANQ
ncbi:MAG: hypothetical protein ACPGOV_11395 [Magnetovibrionaceae bacterium]